MKRYKAGIIGLGVGEQHIAGFRSHPRAEVTRLCDFDPAKEQMARERYPEIGFTTDADAVLTDPDIDMVSIATFDDAHAAQILTALAHGKHVFVEKPLCMYPDEARQIRAALNARPELQLSSNLILRLCPRFLELREAVRRGDYGRLFYLEGDYNYGRLAKIVSGWRGQLPFYSVVHGGGVHLVDLMLWLADEPVVQVCGFGNKIASEGTGFRFNDLVASLLQFESGLVAKMSVNFACVHPHFHPLNVYGTEATFKNGIRHAELFRTRDPHVDPERIETPYPGVHKGALIHSFVESLATGSPALVTAEDVFRTMSVCFAIEKAVQDGTPVIVDYI